MNAHRCVPPCNVGSVGDLELVGNIFVEHAKARSVDVHKREVIIFVTLKLFVGHLDSRLGGKVVVHGNIAWIGN